jgi:hypothetical protein
MKNLILTVLTLVLLNTAFAQRLNNQELQEFYTNRTLIGEHYRLGKTKGYFAPNGKYKCIFENGKSKSGKWNIEDDRRCFTSGGKKLCYYTNKNSDGTYSIISIKKDKEICIIHTIEKGNQL